MVHCQLLFHAFSSCTLTYVVITLLAVQNIWFIFGMPRHGALSSLSQNAATQQENAGYQLSENLRQQRHQRIKRTPGYVLPTWRRENQNRNVRPVLGTMFGFQSQGQGPDLTENSDDPSSGKNVVVPEGYIIEMMPQDSENIHVGQWIYLRVCTKASVVLTPRHRTNTYESELREKLKRTSCAVMDQSRPRFLPNQLLVISVRGVPAINYNIIGKELHLSSSIFSRGEVRFWSMKSANGVLFALRPSRQLDHAIVDVHLEQPIDHHPLPGQRSPVHSFVTFLSGISQAESLNDGVLLKADDDDASPLSHLDSPVDVGYFRSLRVIYLKRFILRFAEEPRRLSLRCNKTGPHVPFDPFRTLASWRSLHIKERDDEGPKQQGHLATVQADLMYEAAVTSSDTPSVLDSGLETKRNSSSNALQHDMFNLLSMGSPSLIWDVDDPEPTTTGEAMDELAIRMAQESLEPLMREANSLLTYTQTSTPLLVPTEPTTRSLTYVVDEGEAVRCTCQGPTHDRPIKIVFDEDIWENISYRQYIDPKHPYETHTDVTLKAKSVTWSNVSQDEFEGVLRFPDQLTSLKCGYHQHSRLLKPQNTPKGIDVPIVQIYFTMVTSDDYMLLKRWLASKQAKTFEPTPPVPRVTFKQRIIRFAAQYFPGNKSKVQSREYPDGFWNMSLAKLSGSKLITCIVFVFLITFVVLVTIVYCSHRKMRVIYIRGGSSTEAGTTLNSGDYALPQDAVASVDCFHTLMRKVTRHRQHTHHRREECELTIGSNTHHSNGETSLKTESVDSNATVRISHRASSRSV